MLGAYAEYAQSFLLVWAIVMTLFAAPIFLVPLAWARVLRFTIPSDTDLAVYFGRCLGAFAMVVEGMMFRAVLTGDGLGFPLADYEASGNGNLVKKRARYRQEHTCAPGGRMDGSNRCGGNGLRRIGGRATFDHLSSPDTHRRPSARKMVTGPPLL
jgi:hypothetical protein